MKEKHVVRLYDHTIKLLTEARCLAMTLDEGGVDRSYYMMLITSRLSAVMAWVLTRKAVLAGELSTIEAKEDEWRLLRDKSLLEDTHRMHKKEPAVMRRLLNRSYRLYVLVEALDARQIQTKLS